MILWTSCCSFSVFWKAGSAARLKKSLVHTAPCVASHAARFRQLYSSREEPGRLGTLARAGLPQQAMAGAGRLGQEAMVNCKRQPTSFEALRTGLLLSGS